MTIYIYIAIPYIVAPRKTEHVTPIASIASIGEIGEPDSNASMTSFKPVIVYVTPAVG